MTQRSVAIVDDHQLIRSGLRLLIEGFENYTILFEAENGSEALHYLRRSESYPDVVLMDIGMPVMDGFETTAILTEFPAIKVIALSVYDDDATISRMMESGAHAYLLKDASTNEVKETLDEVERKGYSYSDRVINSIMQAKEHAIQQKTSRRPIDHLSERERTFITLCCSELTYKEIADKMEVSQRTVDGYRESVFPNWI